MNTNGFRADELISRRIRVNGEWQTKTFPIIAGRLRLAHEDNESNLSIHTELVSWDGNCAVCKSRAITTKGQFNGYGTASSERDLRLADCLVELAETRSIARALRFAGYGLEYTGAEEVSHVSEEQNTEQEQSEGNGNGKAEAKPTNGHATPAQVRAVYTLIRKANYTDEDVRSLLNPLNAESVKDLSLAEASRLIKYLQTEIAQ